MRMLLREVRSLWCLVTKRCPLPGWSLDELKHDDPAFGSHMEWMAGAEQASRSRRHEASRDFSETFAPPLWRQGERGRS